VAYADSEGLSYAFRSAHILAEGLQNVGRRCHRATIPLRRNILLKGLKSRVVFNASLRRLVMTLGLRGMDVYRPQESAHLAAVRQEP
jgi:hypothetical protein